MPTGGGVGTRIILCSDGEWGYESAVPRKPDDRWVQCGEAGLAEMMWIISENEVFISAFHAFIKSLVDKRLAQDA